MVSYQHAFFIFIILIALDCLLQSGWGINQITVEGRKTAFSFGRKADSTTTDAVLPVCLFVNCTLLSLIRVRARCCQSGAAYDSVMEDYSLNLSNICQDFLHIAAIFM